MPANPEQSICTFEYTGRNGTPFKLEFIPGYASQLSSPDTYSFPTNVILKDKIETEWGYNDDLPFGFPAVGVMTLELDLTDLTGENDGDTDFWDVIRKCIIRGVSETAVAGADISTGLSYVDPPDQFIPNRWTLYSGSGYTHKEFIGLQVFNPEKGIETKSNVTTLKIEVNDILTATIQKIIPTYKGMSYSDLNTLSGNNVIMDLIYKDTTIYKYKYFYAAPITYFFATNADLWDFIRTNINDYLHIFTRDNGFYLNTNITKPYTLSDSNDLSHVTLYKQDPESGGTPGAALTNATELNHNWLTTTGGSSTKTGGFYYSSENGGSGWDEYDSLYDILKFSAEGSLCKVFIDFNPATDEIGMGFHKIYDRTLGTTIITIDNTNIYKDKKIEVCPYIVKAVVNLKDTRNDSTNEFIESIASSMSEESQEIQGIWQNNETLSKDMIPHNPSGRQSIVFKADVIAPCRNLYYIDDSPFDARTFVYRVHENITIDLGDSTTYSETADPDYSIFRDTYNTNNANTTMARIVAKAFLGEFKKEYQLYLSAKVLKDLANIGTLGDVYTIDLNSFNDVDYIQTATTTDTLGILINVKTNYYTELSDAKFWIRSN